MPESQASMQASGCFLHGQTELLGLSVPLAGGTATKMAGAPPSSHVIQTMLFNFMVAGLHRGLDNRCPRQMGSGILSILPERRILHEAEGTLCCKAAKAISNDHLRSRMGDERRASTIQIIPSVSRLQYSSSCARIAARSSAEALPNVARKNCKLAVVPS